jgi:predicted AAA+ superfamily ATPase
VVLLPTPEQKIELLKRLFDETYVNDIVGRHRIRNKGEFEELTNILSSGVGLLTNSKKLADMFKTKKRIKIRPSQIQRKTLLRPRLAGGGRFLLQMEITAM